METPPTIDLQVKKLGSGNKSQVFRLSNNLDAPNEIIKVYDKEPEVPEFIKGLVILEAFKHFHGTAPRLTTYDVKLTPNNHLQQILNPDHSSIMIKQTEVVGTSLAETPHPLSLDQFKSTFKNIINQIEFVWNIDPNRSKSIRAIKERFGIKVQTGYHGDISDTAIIINPELNTGTLVDWDHSFYCSDETVDDRSDDENSPFYSGTDTVSVYAHPVYAAKEVAESIITEEDSEPQLADFYSLGGVMARMLLGEEDFYACVALVDWQVEEPIDFSSATYPGVDAILDNERNLELANQDQDSDKISSPRINREKIKQTLEIMSIDPHLIDMIYKLLSDNPSERYLDGTNTPKENMKRIRAILSDNPRDPIDNNY